MPICKGKVLVAAILFGLGFFTLTISLIFNFYAGEKINHQFQRERFSLKSGEFYDEWKSPKYGEIVVYFFNITNSALVLEGQPPIYEEVGPYVYDHYTAVANIQHNPNHTLTYNTNNSCIFNSTLSGNLSDTDVVTIMDYAYMSLVLIATGQDPMLAGRMAGILNAMYKGRETPFLTATVKEHLTEGTILNCNVPDLLTNILCRVLAREASYFFWQDELRNYRFAFLREKNSLNPVTYNAFTGDDDITKRGQIYTVDRKTNLEAWEDPYCGQINGTHDGSSFGKINKIDDIFYFENSLQRSVHVGFKKTDTFENIPVYKYEIDERFFNSLKILPENECFCPTHDPEEENATASLQCPPLGFFSLEKALKAPILTSMPWMHFSSEEHVLEIMQRKSNHSEKEVITEAFIEPITRIVLKGQRTVQFNLELRKSNNFVFLKKVVNRIVPGLWMKLSFQASTNEISDIKSYLNYVDMVQSLLYCGISLGIALLISSLVFYSIRKDNVRSGSTVESYGNFEKVTPLSMAPIRNEYPQQNIHTTAYQQHFM